MPHTNEEMREKLYKLWKELRLEDKTSFEEIPAVIQIENFINQEISDLKKSIREEIEKIENPYKVVVLDTDKSVAEWALLEHGKRMGYERMRDEILSLKSLE